MRLRLVLAGTLASASITGNITSGYELDLTIPRGSTGMQGLAGPANTLSIGTVTSDTTASGRNKRYCTKSDS